MKLEVYEKSINLFEPWQRAKADNNLQNLLEQIQEDEIGKLFLKQNPLPKTQQREWIQAMFTTRPAGFYNEKLFEALDCLLESEKAVHQKADELERLGKDKNLSLWQGDITKLEIDAIVNAANSQMLGCFIPFHACIDNAINSAAGARLREDCKIIMDLQGFDEKTSDAKITRAYDLPSKFVLHTVGPIINSTLKKADIKALEQCYISCLDLANETNAITSLAFCGISTGVYGFPAKEAAEIAVKTTLNWLEQHQQSRIKQVVFNTFDENMTNIYKSELKKWI